MARTAPPHVETRPTVALAAALLLLALGDHARAEMIEIEFDLSADSSVTALGVTVPPNGQVTAASVTISVPGTGPSNPTTGIATMRSFTLNGTVSAVIIATVTGFLDGDQLGNVSATFNTLSLLSIFQPWSLNLTGMLDCTPPFLCGLLGTWPQTFNSVQSITVAYLRLGGLSTPGAATVNGTFPLFLGSIFATVMMIGNEVSRTFVPEPRWSLLLCSGLLLLAALWRLRSARRG